MFKNHFKIAFRHLVKHKVFSLINIGGLAMSMAVAFLILQYLNFELSYDQFHKNRDEIFRVTYKQHENGELKNTSAGTFYGVGAFMQEQFPQVKEMVRFYKWPASTGVLLMAQNRIYNERNYFFAEQSFFKVFPSLLIQGDSSSCLSNPNSIVVSKRLALKIFGSIDVIGRTVNDLDQRNQELIITGIMENVPNNSHFDLDIVRPFEKDWIPEGSYWQYFGTWTYVTLKRGTSIPEFEKLLNESLAKSQKNNSDFKGVSMSVQPITDIHLNSHLNGEIKTNGSRSVVYTIGTAFFIILIIAWINYINLETARFITRIKEIGVRRIIGSSKKELVLQFFVQYLCINILATSLAFIIVYTTLPYYGFVTGVSIHTVAPSVPHLWNISLVFFVAGTFATGIYPALFLLKFNPVASLKGKLTGRVQGIFLRKSLLVFQFLCSIILIAFLIVISQQLDFMRNISGNFNLSRVLTVYNPTNYSAYEDSLRQEKNEVFRNKLLQNFAVENLTTSSAIPGEPVGFTYVDLAKRSLHDPDKQIPYKVIYIDYDFIPVFGLKLKAGRNYSEKSGEDKNAQSLIVTESAIRELGFSSIEEAINKEIYFMEDDWDKWKIVGIVEDYRHESVKSPVYPTIFRLHQNKGQMVYYSARLNTHSHSEGVVSTVEKAWKETWPEKPFDYFFLDNYYDQQYKAEIHFQRIFTTFSAVAIFIACLGILGMTLFEANTRLKEISIRKVLGASIFSLLTLIMKNYFVLVTVAGLIATPLISLSAAEWLKTYPLHVNVSWIIFLVPLVIIILLITIVSVFQSVKTAKTNPVDHLKYE
jgi:putative ABC transport system permease protein